jgi:hypothetical protein
MNSRKKIFHVAFIVALILVSVIGGIYLAPTSRDILHDEPMVGIEPEVLVSPDSQTNEVQRFSNAAKRISADETKTLRRIFSPIFSASNESIRAEGKFVFAGQCIDPATQKKASVFRTQHDYTTMGQFAPFVVLLKENPASSSYNDIFGDVILSSYAPPRGYILLLTGEQLARISEMDVVETIFEVTAEYKTEPFLAWLAEKSETDFIIDVMIRLFDTADVEAVVERVRNIARGFTLYPSFSGENYLIGTISLSQIPELATIGGIEWIEQKSEFNINNNLAVMEPRLNVSRVWEDWLLYGEGQIVGHADTGLDTGDTNTLHLDMRGRVIGTSTWNGRGEWDDLHSHGTHTAGSIIGDGTISDGLIKGAAYKATLFHQSIGTDDLGTLSLPGDPGYLFNEAAQAGAFIHSDSWGSAIFGFYTTFDRFVDLYVWNHQNFLPVIAAGNDGVDGYYTAGYTSFLDQHGIVIPDATADGVIDSQSIGSPALSKNVLAVGATESDRTSGSASSRTWFSLFPSKYKVDPIKTDYASVGIVHDNVYHQGMAAFSSRGPTICGRIKPDVTAPGCDVLSTRYTVGSKYGWGTYPPHSRYYNYNGGTSMACPLAAGAATLAREHVIKRAGIEQPTAALIKALLINGAQSISPGQYGVAEFREIPPFSPNNVEGWGQVNVGNSLYAVGTGTIFMDRIQNGNFKKQKTVNFYIDVVNTNVPLKATLVWADYPSNPAASGFSELVNDFDLLAESPSSIIFHGNGTEGGDRTNNVEKILVENPESGSWRISITAVNLMKSGSLPALVVSGGIDDVPPLIIPHLIEDTPPRAEGYEAVAMINSVYPIEGTGTADFAWAVGDANSATGTWAQTSVYAQNDGQIYKTVIPGTLHTGEVCYAWDMPGAAAPVTNSFTILPFNLELDELSHYFTYTGGASNINVFADISWAADTPDTWILLDTTSGSNDGIVVYSVTTNYVASQRSGTISVYGAIKTNELSVTQGPWNKTPEPPTLARPEVSTSGNTISIVFSAERNNKYTLQWRESLSTGEWLDLVSDITLDDGLLTLSASSFPGHTGLPEQSFFRLKCASLVQ